MIRVDPITGAVLGIIHTEPKDITSIACDPTNGHLYLACAADNNVVAINSSGGVLWTASYGTRVRCVAVTNSGYVYAVGSGGTVKKYDAASGAAITSGWPYTHGAGLTGVCVDQSGNVYVCGSTNVGLKNCVALTNGGSVRWSVRIPDTPGFQTCNGLAIDAAGAGIALAKDGNSPTAQTAFSVDAATGGFVGAIHGQQMGCAACGYVMGYQLVGGVANAGGYRVRKDLLVHYKGVFTISSLAVGPDNREFAAQGSSGVWSITDGWSITGAFGTTFQNVETSAGRVGAFGL
ncbi:MAG: SBBP repeat-containing protein [Planctomycetota bacterium]